MALTNFKTQDQGASTKSAQYLFFSKVGVQDHLYISEKEGHWFGTHVPQTSRLTLQDSSHATPNTNDLKSRSQVTILWIRAAKIPQNARHRKTVLSRSIFLRVQSTEDSQAFSLAPALFLGRRTAWMLGKTPPWAMVTPARSLFSSSSFLGRHLYTTTTSSERT